MSFIGSNEKYKCQRCRYLNITYGGSNSSERNPDTWNYSSSLQLIVEIGGLSKSTITWIISQSMNQIGVFLRYESMLYKNFLM